MTALVVPLTMTTRIEVVRRNIVMILTAGTVLVSMILVTENYEPCELNDL